MGRKATTLETIFIVNGQAGEVFYTDKRDSYISALANYYKRKVTTKMVLVVVPGTKPEIKQITRVTLL